MKHLFKKTASSVTFLFFLITQAFTPVQAQPSPVSEVGGIRESPLRVEIPSDLGTLETFVPGQGPVLIHIQTAHGNYQAQKSIQALLHYLHKKYGVKTLLLEGSAFKLEPEMLRYFPNHPNATRMVNDALAKEALVKGPELFLVEEPSAEGYGIENLEAYVENGEVFKAVLTEQERTKEFLKNMEIQIERLTAPYLSKDLRNFLRQDEAYQMKRLPLEAWFGVLKKEAKKRLRLELERPIHQLEWPMLTRIYRLREIEEKFDSGEFVKERENFLKAIQLLMGSDPVGVRPQVKSLLKAPFASHGFSDSELVQIFEQMVQSLPQDFPYDQYPQVKLAVAHLVFQSEIEGGLLMEEAEALSQRIALSMTSSEQEREILALLRDFRLLKKLFALILTPQDWQQIQGRVVVTNVGADLRVRPLPDDDKRVGPTHGSAPTEFHPSAITQRFLALNDAKRVKNVRFDHLEDLDLLFELAAAFYEGVEERDGWMLENIEKKLAETGVKIAAVVTGGFHTGPFQDYLTSRGYTYALIAPKMEVKSDRGLELDRELYVRSVLQSGPGFLAASTRETPLAALGLQDREEQLGTDGALALAASEMRTVVETAAAQAFDRPPTVEDLREIGKMSEILADLNKSNWSKTHGTFEVVPQTGGRLGVKVTIAPASPLSDFQSISIPLEPKGSRFTPNFSLAQFSRRPGRSESRSESPPSADANPERAKLIQLTEGLQKPLRINAQVPDIDTIRLRESRQQGVRLLMERRVLTQGSSKKSQITLGSTQIDKEATAGARSAAAVAQPARAEARTAAVAGPEIETSIQAVVVGVPAPATEEPVAVALAQLQQNKAQALGIVSMADELVGVIALGLNAQQQRRFVTVWNDLSNELTPDVQKESTETAKSEARMITLVQFQQWEKKWGQIDRSLSAFREALQTLPEKLKREERVRIFERGLEELAGIQSASQLQIPILRTAVEVTPPVLSTEPQVSKLKEREENLPLRSETRNVPPREQQRPQPKEISPRPLVLPLRETGESFRQPIRPPFQQEPVSPVRHVVSPRQQLPPDTAIIPPLSRRAAESPELRSEARQPLVAPAGRVGTFPGGQGRLAGIPKLGEVPAVPSGLLKPSTRDFARFLGNFVPRSELTAILVAHPEAPSQEVAAGILEGVLSPEEMAQRAGALQPAASEPLVAVGTRFQWTPEAVQAFVQNLKGRKPGELRAKATLRFADIQYLNRENPAVLLEIKQWMEAVWEQLGVRVPLLATAVTAQEERGFQAEGENPLFGDFNRQGARLLKGVELADYMKFLVDFKNYFDVKVLAGGETPVDVANRIGAPTVNLAQPETGLLFTPPVNIFMSRNLFTHPEDLLAVGPVIFAAWKVGAGTADMVDKQAVQGEAVELLYQILPNGLAKGPRVNYFGVPSHDALNELLLSQRVGTYA